MPIKTLKTWFEEIVVTRKREELSQLLIKLMNTTRGDKTITLPSVIFPTQDGKLKPKSESNTELKSVKTEPENKRKSTLDTETRVLSVVTENAEPTNELVSRTTTYQIITYSSCVSSNATDSNSTEMLTEPKTQRYIYEDVPFIHLLCVIDKD